MDNMRRLLGEMDNAESSLLAAALRKPPPSNR
jgi:hypothetical protein